MKILIVVAILFFFTFTPVYAEEADKRIYVIGKTLENEETDARYSELPPYLRYPNDAISEMMFGKSMKEIINRDCNYKFMLYTDVADQTPQIEEQSPPFDRNETHYYFKDGQAAWYSISTMKHESVRENSVKSWIEKADQLMLMAEAYDEVLRVPKSMRGRDFKNVGMYYIEQNELYNQLHGFDESHLYCRVFYLGDQLYKKFILLAKKDDWSWRVEENIPTRSEEFEPPDFVPPGQTFGKFYPLNSKLDLEKR